MTRINPKTKRAMTETQNKMYKVCEDMIMSSAQAGAALFFLQKEFDKVLKSDELKDNEEGQKEIIEFMVEVKENLANLNEVISFAKETQTSILNKKKDKFILKKTKELVNSDKVKKIKLKTLGDKIKETKEILDMVKEKYNINDPKDNNVVDVDGDIIGEVNEVIDVDQDASKSREDIKDFLNTIDILE